MMLDKAAVSPAANCGHLSLDQKLSVWWLNMTGKVITEDQNLLDVRVYTAEQFVQGKVFDCCFQV